MTTITTGPVHLPGARARFTTSNVDEGLPGVLTPLTWSFYFPKVEEATRAAWCGFGALSRTEAAVPDEADNRFFTPVLGHAATNVELFGRMADRMPGGSAAKMEEHLFGALDQDFTPERWRQRRYPVVAAKAGWTLRRAMRELPPLADRTRRWWTTATSGDDASDPARLLLEARDRLGEVLGTHLILSMAAQGVLERVAKVAADAGFPGLENELIRSDEGTEEFAIVADLHRLAGRDIGMADFLARHGYHGPREGQLDAVVWREDPALVESVVEAYRGREAESTPQIIARRRAEHVAACARLDAALSPLRRRPVRGLIRFASNVPVWRETGRASILRCVDVGRLAARRLGHALAEGGHLDHPEDVFFLTVDELVTGASGDLRALVKARRAEHEVFEQTTLPHVWRGTPELEPGLVPGPSVGRRLEGLGVSSGVAEGTVVVVHDQREADLPEGSVLVCRATDPGWASLFPLVEAVVTDVGSAMSHAAIVCRELGLPCVANTRDGTARLRDGMRVRVDGSAGVVEILDAAGTNGP